MDDSNTRFSSVGRKKNNGDTNDRFWKEKKREVWRKRDASGRVVLKKKARPRVNCCMNYWNP